MSDISIAQSIELKHIKEVAQKIHVNEDDLELYGKHKAKLPLSLIDEKKIAQHNLILVTGISPTPAGEGKTTVSIGLAEALNKYGKKTAVVLREPSLGPVFGMKGGAAGGGYSQVLPMEDINLHFTGDFSAIEKAHNLLAALIDNNLQSKSRSLNLDPRTIAWKRVMDMNDRALRKTVVGLGGLGQGIPRETGFDITAASEIMAILCLSEDLEDLKKRVGNIFIGLTYAGEPIYARDLNAPGAMASLLKDAIKPNLVQTLQGNPAIIHGGPFANIAQGTNSVIATKMGLSLAPYVVTEAGFGADLGAEKFLDIKCQSAGISPKAVVIVATCRALKFHGGIHKDKLQSNNPEAILKGIVNLEKHIENIKKFNLPPVVVINKFLADTPEEIQVILNRCAELGVHACSADIWSENGGGTENLARTVAQVVENNTENFKPLYNRSAPTKEKIEKIAKEIYGADRVEYGAQARKDLRKIEKLGVKDLAVCIAKTQYSFSDNPKLLGRPTGFSLHIRNIEIAAGAGFIVPIAGNMMRMPGLPTYPAAEKIDIDSEGRITGLF